MTHQHTTQSKASEHDRASQSITTVKSAAAPAMHPMLHLQRQVGNQAVGRLIQAKLTVGEPNDVYEQEADRMAAAVVSQIHAPQNVSTGQSASVQRQAAGNEEEELRRKPIIQCKSDVGGMAVSSEIESSIQQARGSGQPLSDSIRTPMEQAFGADFSGVRVHTDAPSHQLNQSIQAKAFTTGQDIFFRQGEYSPGSRGGQELLAHELTHVVQQTTTEEQPKRSMIDYLQPISATTKGMIQRGGTGKEEEETAIKAEDVEAQHQISTQPYTVDQDGYQIKAITTEGKSKEEKELKSQVLNELQKWKVFAEKQNVENLDKEQSDTRLVKMKLREEYYTDQQHLEKRRRRKFVKRKLADIEGCIGEAQEISNELTKDSPYTFLVAIKEKQIHGLVQVIETGYIANLVVSPYNWKDVEPPQEHKRQEGTLRTLLISAFQWNQKYGTNDKKEVTLVALNSQIKKIYDNYGFEVYFDKPQKEEEEGTFKRPIVLRHQDGSTKGWKVEDSFSEKLKRREKLPWYLSNYMKITLAGQERFKENQYARYMDRKS